MKWFTIILSTVVSLLFAVVYGVVYWGVYGVWSLFIDAAMLLAVPLCSLLHELGHMLFGAICKIKAKPQFKLFGSSSCELIPKTDKNLRARLYFTAAGGVIINFIMFSLSIFSVEISGCPVWLSLFAPASIYLFIMNSVPTEFSNGKTDGFICNGLILNTDEAKVMLAVLTVQAKVLKGTPIYQIDEKLLFDLPQIREDDESFIALTELRYEYCKAKGDEKSAEQYKNRFEQLKNNYL